LLILEDTEIWCHEIEFKDAFWQYATGISRVLHRPHYLTVHDLNWKTFSTPSWPLLPGITLHRCPGHTDGSIIAEFQLENEGTVVATSDLFHVKENFELGRPQGTLITDFTSWHRSRWYVKNLVERKRAKVILGHDEVYFETFKSSPAYQASGYAS
jgi:glyoxylase-like metal-dependent hydrolase (beta-lactamase superfamily II)